MKLFPFFCATIFFSLQAAAQNLQEQCLRLNTTSKVFYSDGKCLVREGLRDMSKNRECNLLPNGHLMTQKTENELNEIVEALKDTTSYKTAGSEYHYALHVRLSENFKPGQTLQFKGHITDMSAENHDRTKLRLEGVNDSFVQQHIPLQMAVQHDHNEVVFWKWPQKSDGTTNTKINVTPDEEQIPYGLRINDIFDMTVKYRNDSQLEIKVGTFTRLHPYDNETLHYINTINFYGQVELYSATLDGKELLFDEDRYYSDCMAVGFTNTNQLSSGYIEGLVQEIGYVADPDSTLVESDAKEPDKSNEDHYGCVNIHTKQVKDVPSYLKRYIVCEYEPETTKKCYQGKGNKRAAEQMVIKSESGITTKEMCAKLCARIISCRSFSVNLTVGECEVYRLTSDHDDMMWITDDTADGYIFYDAIYQ